MIRHHARLSQIGLNVGLFFTIGQSFYLADPLLGGCVAAKKFQFKKIIAFGLGVAKYIISVTGSVMLFAFANHLYENFTLAPALNSNDQAIAPSSESPAFRKIASAPNSARIEEFSSSDSSTPVTDADNRGIEPNSNSNRASGSETLSDAPVSSRRETPFPVNPTPAPSELNTSQKIFSGAFANTNASNGGALPSDSTKTQASTSTATSSTSASATGTLVWDSSPWDSGQWL